MLPFFRDISTCGLTETGCACRGAAGIVEGTALRVRGGWRRIERVERRDYLHVYPKGRLQPGEICRERIWLDSVDCPEVSLPVHVPLHALGNREEFLLQQEMRVLLHDPGMRPILGTGHVTIRAADLVGFRGIAPAHPPQASRLIRPLFDREQFVLAAGGAWILCPPEPVAFSSMAEDDSLHSVIGKRMIRHLDTQEAGVFLEAQERRGLDGDSVS